VVDSLALPQLKDRVQNSVHVGKNWNRNFKSIFEFKLPEMANSFTKATLRLKFHGTYWCYPQKPDAHGPETEIYYYLAPEADGKVELTDDTGVKIGVAIKADPLREKTSRYIYLDVTNAVREAIAQKSTFIGFKLEATSEAPGKMHWDLVAREFANSQKAPFIGPCLVIYDK
jgi:hypothetical protein